MPKLKHNFDTTGRIDLDEWIDNNWEHMRNQYGINLAEDKDQWIMQLLLEVYDHCYSNAHRYVIECE